MKFSRINKITTKSQRKTGFVAAILQEWRMKNHRGGVNLTPQFRVNELGIDEQQN